MLPVKFDQQGRHLPQQIEADRLVIDRGPAWPIGILDPTDDDFAIGINVLLGEKLKGCMCLR